MKSASTLGRTALIGVGVTAVFIALAFVVEGDIGKSTRTAITAPPLELWSAVALDDARQARGEAVEVCTNPMVRQGFGLPLPRIDGEVCLLIGQPQERGRSFNARCSAGGRQYGVNIARSGDPDADFTVRMRARPLDLDDPGVVQTIRYHKLGPCPAGAVAGQASKPGRLFDALDSR